MESGNVKDFVETMAYNDNVLEYRRGYYLFVGFDYTKE